MRAGPSLLLVPLASLAGCEIDFTQAGTAVGNPTDMASHVAQAQGLDYTGASARVSTLSAGTCAGQTTVYTLAETVDLLGATSIPVPAGAWCSFTLTFESPVTLTGTSPSSGPFSLSLAVRAVTVKSATPVVTDDGPLVLELGTPGWLTEADLDPTGPGGAVDNPTLIKLEGTIASASTLFHDHDEDGVVDPEERDEGRLAEGEGSEEEEDEDED